MAFHNPDPKLQALERQNARLRAAAFAMLFRALWRRLKGLPARLRQPRRPPGRQG